MRRGSSRRGSDVVDAARKRVGQRALLRPDPRHARGGAALLARDEPGDDAAELRRLRRRGARRRRDSAARADLAEPPTNAKCEPGRRLGGGGDRGERRGARRDERRAAASPTVRERAALDTAPRRR